MNWKYICNRKAFWGMGKGAKRKKGLREEIAETLEIFEYFHTYKKTAMDDVFDKKLPGITIKIKDDRVKFKIGDTKIKVEYDWDAQGPHFGGYELEGADKEEDLKVLLRMANQIANFLKQHEEEEFELSRKKGRERFIAKLKEDEERRRPAKPETRPEWESQKEWINSNYD